MSDVVCLEVEKIDFIVLYFWWCGRDKKFASFCERV